MGGRSVRHQAHLPGGDRAVHRRVRALRSLAVGPRAGAVPNPPGCGRRHAHPCRHGDAVPRLPAGAARSRGEAPGHPDRHGSCAGSARRGRAGRQPLVALGLLCERPDRRGRAGVQRAQAHRAPRARRRAFRPAGIRALRRRIRTLPLRDERSGDCRLVITADHRHSHRRRRTHRAAGLGRIAGRCPDDRLPAAALPAVRGRQPGLAVRRGRLPRPAVHHPDLAPDWARDVRAGLGVEHRARGAGCPGLVAAGGPPLPAHRSSPPDQRRAHRRDRRDLSPHRA